MKENKYEILSPSLKIRWLENYKITDQKYTQVSGYVLDKNNNLLIVKSGDNYTIPGGHPEDGETPIQTLEREIMEEACISIKDIKYLGAVEVVENGDTYYQLRYMAKVQNTLSFTQKYETTDRKFASLKDLPHYITWSSGKTFKEQIESMKEKL